MIEIERVSFSYGYGGPRALDDVMLRIGDGEVVGVVGENGAGKTTLLKLVAGLLRPSRGVVRVDGAAEPRAIRRSVAYVPDDGGAYPLLTVDEIGRLLGEALPAWDEAAWARSLERLALPRPRRAGALSRGQRARLRLAEGLAQRTPVLVLDEPLAGIDPASREAIVGLVAADLAETPRTVVVATHEVAEVEPLLSRVVVLDGGRVVVDAAADELRAASGTSLDRYLRQGVTR
jgi:ABC-2 type transport system ATP-binding protein